MSDIQTESQPAPVPHHRLAADLFRFAVFKLHNDVPPPDTKDPELIAQFVNAGIAQIASMVPANAEEIVIAVRILNADAQASDCIRHARSLSNDPTPAMECHAHANHYMRTANAARSLLLRVQSARRKREAVPAFCTSDDWTIHATEGLLAAAAAGDDPTSWPGLTRPPEPPPPPPPAEPPPPAASDADAKFASYDEAEQYALIYPNRAAEIRAHGGVPPTARYGPPDAQLVAQLIASASPVLQQIDKEYQAAPAPT